jgi:hypothetical protein
MNRVEDLEEAWLKWMRGTFRPSEALLARNAKPSGPAANSGALSEFGQPIVQGGAAVIRGASPDDGSPAHPTSWPRGNAAPSNRNDGWTPAQNAQRGPVKLLAPQPEP